MRVNLGGHSYEIVIDNSILRHTGNYLQQLGLVGPVLVVSDAHVAPLWSEIVLTSLKSSGFTPVLVTLPPGEGAKTLGWAAHLYSSAINFGLERSSPIIALGGGVVGDSAGFVAATYLRGVPFIQLPTSLLAQVDSGVGGKVALNLPEGKNLVGAFYQPRFVLCDLETLRTLPAAEFHAALGEVIKYGAILDVPFLDYLEQELRNLLALNTNVLTQVVERCCRLKADVVARDERETGCRTWLNFGHTIGHVLEAASGFRLSHGAAVAAGMAVESQLAQRLGLLAAEEVGRLVNLLEQAGLPTGLYPAITWEEARSLLYRDKKVQHRKLRFALPGPLGRTQTIPVAEEEVAKLWGKQ